MRRQPCAGCTNPWLQPTSSSVSRLKSPAPPHTGCIRLHRRPPRTAGGLPEPGGCAGADCVLRLALPRGAPAARPRRRVLRAQLSGACRLVRHARANCLVGSITFRAARCLQLESAPPPWAPPAAAGTQMYQRLTWDMGAQVLLVPSAFTKVTGAPLRLGGRCARPGRAASASVASPNWAHTSQPARARPPERPRAPGAAHWEVLLRARAIECQAYVIAAAQAGRHNEKRESYGAGRQRRPWRLWAPPRLPLRGSAPAHRGRQGGGSEAPPPQPKTGSGGAGAGRVRGKGGAVCAQLLRAVQPGAAQSGAAAQAAWRAQAACAPLLTCAPPLGCPPGSPGAPCGLDDNRPQPGARHGHQ